MQPPLKDFFLKFKNCYEMNLFIPFQLKFDYWVPGHFVALVLDANILRTCTEKESLHINFPHWSLISFMEVSFHFDIDPITLLTVVFALA